jgi:hypothetical protein
MPRGAGECLEQRKTPSSRAHRATTDHSNLFLGLSLLPTNRRCVISLSPRQSIPGARERTDKLVRGSCSQIRHLYRATDACEQDAAQGERLRHQDGDAPLTSCRRCHPTQSTTVPSANWPPRLPAQSLSTCARTHAAPPTMTQHAPAGQRPNDPGTSSSSYSCRSRSRRAGSKRRIRRRNDPLPSPAV